MDVIDTNEGATDKLKKKIQSSIAQLSVGDERKCFNQIRKAALYIQPETLLWNGWPAGKFALDYVIGHHMKRKMKAEEKKTTGPQRRKRKAFDDENHKSSSPDDENIDLMKTKRRRTKKEPVSVSDVQDIPVSPPPQLSPPRKERKRRTKKENVSVILRRLTGVVKNIK